MAEVKITVIGGGSYAWSPGIMRDIALTRDLSGTIALMDIDPEPLNVIVKIGDRIVKETKADFKVEGTTNRQEALKEADYVILTITTGGLATMKHDLEIPLKYGIYQSVGDTTGPGGISRALRNIPVVVEIAKDMEELCPQAWLINYTNPMTTLCRAVYRTTRIRTIGLCHELFGTLHMIQKIFGTENPEDIKATVAGINHLIWILDLRVKGEDGLALLRDYIERNGVSVAPVKLELFKVFGYLPAAGDRHVAEFFPYFLTEKTQAGSKYGVKLTTIADRIRWRDQAMKLSRELLAMTKPPEQLMRKSQEEAADIISCLANRRDGVFIMNLPNRGQINNLPRENIVETYGVAGARGAQGMTVGDLPDGVLNILFPHVIKHELTVEAAIRGNKQLALQALLTDPLVKDFEDAKNMLDELLEANKDYLPQFYPRK